MGAQRTSFDKLQRDRAKKAKASLKRERRVERVVDVDLSEGPDQSDDGMDDQFGELSPDQLLKRIESIHQWREAGTISLEDFEKEKAALLGRLPID